MKILKHSLTVLSFFLMIILTGMGYFYWGLAAFLLSFAWCQQQGNEEGNKLQGIEEIDKMDGFEFERYTAEIYKRLGYKAKVTQEQGDFGADVIAWRGSERIAIQCKRYKDKVSIDAVYQVLGGKNYYKCSKALVLTNSTFTEPALTLAKCSGVDMIDREGLKKIIKMAENRNVDKG